MIKVAVYDTKPYDREYFAEFDVGDKIKWAFHEFRLGTDSVATASGASAVCVFVSDILDAPCLEALSQMNVRHVALRCAGYNNVDVEAAKRFGFSVTRVPAYSPHAVAEHAVSLFLTLNRRIHRAYNRVREHNFSLNGLVGFDVYGKTVGIVGTGMIGKLTAEIFGGFKARVLAYDPFADKAWAERQGVHYVDLESLLGESDVVSLHSPLLPETHHMLNERTIGMMKPGAYLLNTSRGKLIDTAALIAALKARQLGGVALDVYEEEEGVFFEDLSGEVLLDDELSRLLTFPNVLITAHQAFLTREALQEIARVTIGNLVRFAGGEEWLSGTAL